MATQGNISGFVGEDLVWSDTIKDSGGNPVNITGYALRCIVVRLPGGAAKITKTVGAGIVLTNPSGGIATITIAAADTAALGEGLWYWYVSRTDAGQDTCLSWGFFILQAQQ